MIQILPHLVFSAMMFLFPQNSGSGVTARPCGADTSSPAQSKKKPPKQLKTVPEERTSVCIELSTSALEIQEYVQSFSRSQQWKIDEEHLSDDSWTITRGLSKEELLEATKAEESPSNVAWTGGSVLLHITTLSLPDGFARAVIEATFRGYGRGPDHFAPRPEFWRMRSNCSLENGIVAALKAHFKVTA